MQLNEFLARLKKSEPISFDETMEVIDHYYKYTPCEFQNGEGKDLLTNKSGENQGSCKIFAFGKLHSLSEELTLSLFGDFYRKDVLEHPNGTNHANIRIFLKYGWKGIKNVSNVFCLGQSACLTSDFRGGSQHASPTPWRCF